MEKKNKGKWQRELNALRLRSSKLSQLISRLNKVDNPYDIPEEYFLSLWDLDENGAKIGVRQIDIEHAWSLYQLRLTHSQLGKLRRTRLAKLEMVHEKNIEVGKDKKVKGNVRLRKARSRAKSNGHQANLAKQELQYERLTGQLPLREAAYSYQEAKVQVWFPRYYKEGRFDAAVFGQRLRRELHGMIPTTVVGTEWGKLASGPISMAVKPEEPVEARKQNPEFREFVVECYKDLCDWYPPERREAQAFQQLPKIVRAYRPRFIKKAEDLTVVIVNHVFPQLKYTASDLRYLLHSPSVSQKQRKAKREAEEVKNAQVPDTVDIQDIRKQGYNAAFDLDFS